MPNQTVTAAQQSHLADESSPATLSGHARRLYGSAGTIHRAMATYRPYICPMHRLLALVPVGSTVLDVGCGGGLFLGLLAVTERIQKSAGFDMSALAIAEAKAMADRLPDPSVVSFHLGDSPAVVPSQSDGFDVVSIIDVLHHVPTAAQEAFFRAAAARVRVGGLLLYKDMVDHPDWRAWANSVHDLVVARQVVRYAPISRVEAWAKAAGLVEKDAARENVLWYGHELRLFERTA